MSCPQTGKWIGSGARFDIDFYVSGDGTSCQAYAMVHDLSVVCTLPDGGSWTYYAIGSHLENAAISDDRFSTRNSNATTTVTGLFGSRGAASGTWSHYHFNPSNLATCRGSGSWTGVRHRNADRADAMGQSRPGWAGSR